MSGVFKIKDSEAIVRVKNTMGTGHMVVHDGDKAIFFPAGSVRELTWKTWIKCQDDKMYQKYLELDESVTITEDGEIILYGVKMVDGEILLSIEDMKTYFAIPIDMFRETVADLSVANLERLKGEALERGKEEHVKILDVFINTHDAVVDLPDDKVDQSSNELDL